MKLIDKHRKAMNFSFLAKQADIIGDIQTKNDYYKKAVKLEQEVADFYLNRLDLEPTRTIILNSLEVLKSKINK